MVVSQQPRIHHVGIVVPDFAQVEGLMQLLGLRQGITEYVARYDADCVFTEGPATMIEFVVPRGGLLTRFNKGMGGIHHIALEIDDIERIPADLAIRDVKFLEERPVDAGSLWINFVSPAYTRGIIVEYVQTKANA